MNTDRTKYLELCKGASAAVKDDDALMVEYNGVKYYPYAYQLRFDDKGNAVHTAVMVENNTIMYARLQDVKECGDV